MSRPPSPFTDAQRVERNCSVRKRWSAFAAFDLVSAQPHAVEGPLRSNSRVPLITQILEQKRRANRRNIHLDGKYAFACNVAVVARFRLRVGLTLSDRQIADIKQNELRQDCFDDAMRLLQNRLHSERELRQKLTRKEHLAELIHSVIDDLKRMGYVDDARFAKTKAQSAATHRHHGKLRARMELLKAGVDRTTASRAVEDVYDSHDSLAVARTLAQKQALRLRKLEPVVARRRLAGMLLRRGFTYDDVRPVIDEVLGANHNPEVGH